MDESRRLPSVDGTVQTPISTVVRPVCDTRIEVLHCWPDNPRTISKAGLKHLKHALVAQREMLWARPLIALLDGTVIAGNQRLLAAIELGWKTIPVIFVDLDPGTAQMWALRDNNAYGEWDEPKLAEILAGLKTEGVDLALAGFADRDLDRILAQLPAGPADPDEVPALPAAPVSKPGEMWNLGVHRLVCGDVRDPEVLARLCQEALADVLWTDPPYGISYVGKTSEKLTIENDGADAVGMFGDMLAAVDSHLAPSARFYVCSPAGPNGTGFRVALDRVGWRHHQTLVWVKNTFVLGHSDHQIQHEDVLYGWKPGEGRPGRGRHPGTRWYGGNDVSSVFFHDKPTRSLTHPTSKPVGLVAAQLTNSSLRGDIVLDPFAGSGSTLIACEQLGRRCFAVEIDPRYCDVIRRRYEDYTRGR